MCFLFSFTVFLVSLLHCEHLAIGVHFLEWGVADIWWGRLSQMGIGLTLGIIFQLGVCTAGACPGRSLF